MSYPAYDTSNPKLLESVVCFADILGFSQLVKESEKNEEGDLLLYDLHKTLTSEYAQILHYEPQASIKTFTDNIILAYPMYEDGEGQTGSVVTAMIYFQLQMTLRGYFIRGGISQDKYYGDEQFAYGPALIEAHHLEAEKAQFPRIILSEKMTKIVKAHLNYYGKIKHAPQYSHILCDLKDNRWFINYLYGIVEDFEEKQDFERVIETLKEHQKNIKAKLNEFENNEEIKRKYSWIANYHNYFCKTYIKKEVLDQEEILIKGYEERRFSRITK